MALAALLMSTATPAMAEVIVPLGILPAPIIAPAIEVVPDTEVTEEGLAPDRFTVIAGVAIGSDYEGSDDQSLGPAVGASARVRGHAIAWQGNSLGIDLVPAYRKQRFKFSVAPFVSLNLNRTGKPRDPVVALIRKRKKAVEGGIELGFTRRGIFASRADSLTVAVSGAYDLGSVHRSFIVTPSVAYAASLSKAVSISASASFDMVGASYARYYFGIDGAANASSGLPLYRPKGGVKSVSIGVGGAVSLCGDLRKGFAVGAKLRYQRLLGDFASSPIVAMRGSPNQLGAALATVYTF